MENKSVPMSIYESQLRRGLADKFSEKGIEFLLRAVNTHEELLAGIAYVSNLSEFQEGGKYDGAGKAFRQLIAKAKSGL